MKKIAAFTDIHFGRRGNDKVANQDNIDFIRWFIDEAKTWGADTCIMLGDWHDNRHSLHVSTLNYSLTAMRLLNAAFARVFIISGNHDLFYRERRDLNSVEFGRHLPNITIVNEPTEHDGIALLPWLVGDEWKLVRQLQSRYIFGHLELPGFLMNARVAMPDHGGINAKHFKHQEYVFSGHFHLRQQQGNVVYIGNTYPFNYTDAWDDARGCMLLELGKEPEFRTWPEQPTFRTMKLSELVEDPGKFLKDKVSARIQIDADITYEEATFLRDSFVSQFGARKIDLMNSHKEESTQEYDPHLPFESVDTMVINGLSSVESVGIKRELLIDIYKSL